MTKKGSNLFIERAMVYSNEKVINKQLIILSKKALK